MKRGMTKLTLEELKKIIGNEINKIPMMVQKSYCTDCGIVNMKNYMVYAEKKSGIVKDLQKSKEDTGSAAVQVGIFTERIRELTEHLKVNKKDFAARRGLLQLVGKRKRLLQYIAAQDGQAYLNLIKKLGIRR